MPSHRCYPFLVVGLSLVVLQLPTGVGAELPASGPVVPELAPLEEAMTNMMANHALSEGTIALMKDSKLVLRQGYGWRDQHRVLVMHPDNLFRLASISKTLTMSAIRKLVKEGRISPTTKVCAYLNYQPWGGVLGDGRIADITIQNLLDHRGGWTTGPTGAEAVFQSARIGKEMGLNRPATAAEVIRWKFSKPLDAAPGTTNVYSNLGYQILGRVIEKASGKPYINYLQENLLGPSVIDNSIGFKNIVQSHSPPQAYAPWEVWYADGGHNFESFDSFGGLSASAIGLCRYMQHYWVGGDRRFPGAHYTWTYTFFGGLAGASTVIYQQIKQDGGSTNGLEFAILFNGGKSFNGKAPSNDAFDAVRNVAKNITSWPATGGGEVQWTVSTTNVVVNASGVTVQLERSGLTTLPVSFSYTTYNLTAGTNCFRPTSGVVLFQSGETNKPITVPILPGASLYAGRRFLLELISSSGDAWLGDRVTCVVNLVGPTNPAR
jgi:CubicO group peptidase (beta-lactamase class C family)